jgi:hypothetical protein
MNRLLIRKLAATAGAADAVGHELGWRLHGRRDALARQHQQPA